MNRVLLMFGLFFVMLCQRSVAQVDATPCIFDDYLGRAFSGDSYSAIEKVGDLVYSVSVDGIFTIIDLTDVTNPTLIGTVDIGGEGARKLVVRDGVAFVSQNFDFPKTIDVHNPGAPVLVGTLTDVFLTAAGDIALGDDGRVILHWFDNSVYYIDISDPSNPSLIESDGYPAGGNFGGCVIDGTIAYILTDVLGTLSIESWDITDMSNRTLLSSELVRFDDTESGFSSIAILNSKLYVIDQLAGLFVYDISSPGFPVFLSSLSEARGQELAVSEDQIFISDGHTAVQVVDVSDPLKPMLVGAYDTQGSVDGVVAKDGVIMVSGGDGFELVDISNPVHPYSGNVQTSNAFDVGVIGNVAVVPDLFGGVKFVDVADIKKPRIIHSVPGSGINVHESGQYAFIANGHLGLDTWDVSDPENIVAAGGLDSANQLIADVFVDGQYAYITDNGVDLMKVIDVSDVGHPTIVGSVPINVNAGTIVVSDGRAYVGSFGDVGLEVFDVSDPLNPSSLGSFGLSDTALGIEVRWPYAYIATRTGGLTIIDISDPQNMSMIGELETVGSTVDLQLVGDIAYVVNNSHGVELIDIRTPENPMLIGSYANENSASGLRVVEGVLYLSSVDLGLEIVDLRVGCVACQADLTGDGLLDFFDISLFLQRYGASDLSVDLNADGSLDFFDISAFLVLFQNGCS